MARTDPTIYMRIPPELKDALDAAAAANKRSLTAEVVARLEESLACGTSFAPPNIERLIKDVAEIKKQMQKSPLHIHVRRDGSVALYGSHKWAYSVLLKQGIETEQKHDHHLVEKQVATAAIKVLEDSEEFSITFGEDKEI